MTCGIYHFKIGPHSYIGSAVDVERRIGHHKWRLERGRHNAIAQNAYNKYQTFEWQIIDVCAEEHLFSREGMFQAFYNPKLSVVREAYCEDTLSENCPEKELPVPTGWVTKGGIPWCKGRKFPGRGHSEKQKSHTANLHKKVVGTFWWNNGEVNKRTVECPGEGFVRGKLPSKRVMKN